MKDKLQHKLNNLLGIAAGNLELLQADAMLSDKAQSRVNKVATALNEISALVHAGEVLINTSSDPEHLAQISEDNNLNKGQKIKILVVDDEVELLQILEQQLQIAGYQVITTSEPQLAPNILAQEPHIQLLISDIVMPGDVNGITLAKRCKSDFPALNILLMTGYAKELEKPDTITDHYLRELCHNALKKPFSYEELLTKIRFVLNNNEQS